MQRMLIGGLAVLGAAAMLSYFVAFKPYRIPTASMEPTVNPGDRVILGRFATDVMRGDLVVFRNPADPKHDLMKRVVGLPCDTIELRDKQLFVNGAKASEPYVLHEDEETYRDSSLRMRDQFGPYVVPARRYFVLGDNRDNSNDSRYLGAIPAEDIRGRIVFVLGQKHFARPPRPPVLASLPACRSISFAPPATPATTPAR